MAFGILECNRLEVVPGTASIAHLTVRDNH